VPTITYEDKTIKLEEDQSVLDALLGADFDIPHGCRAGACHSCLMQASEGELPEDAQKGLKETQQINNYFLACACVPEDNLSVTLPNDDTFRIACEVISKKNLSHDVIEIRLKPAEKFTYKAGQYLTLWKDHLDGRSYSLASVPELDDDIILQIRDYPSGVLSEWVHRQLKAGATVDIQGAYGDCYYVDGNLDKPMLLIGTSTGLAPLYGILRDALNRGHSGDIHLYHGALQEDGLYLVDELTQLAANTENFHYHPSVMNAEKVTNTRLEIGAVDELALAQATDLKDYKIYLCGAPDLVSSLKKIVFLQGANVKNIYSDPFLQSSDKDK